MECGDLVIDLASRNVTLWGEAVNLTPTEYNLLALLGRFHGNVLAFQQNFAEVWGPTTPLIHSCCAATLASSAIRSNPIAPVPP